MNTQFILTFAMCLTATLSFGSELSPREYLSEEQYDEYEDDTAVDVLDAKRLSSASTIISGRVLTIKHVSHEALGTKIDPAALCMESVPEDVYADVYKSTISVGDVIAGDIEAARLPVEVLLGPLEDSYYSYLQPLATGKNYIFFLRKEEGDEVWKGVWPTCFAIRTEVQLNREGSSPPQEWLRKTAKANIRKSDDRCAAIWFRFLGQLYDQNQDHDFCLEMANDPRAIIRGKAILLLCKHHPDTEGLYEKSFDYISEKVSSSDQGNSSAGIIWQLPRLLEHKYPETINDVLKDWLQDDKRYMREVALTSIKEEKRHELEPFVIECMDRIEDPREKYDYFKTLCVLRNGQLVSTTLFLKNPDAYTKQFRK